jgi:hypothetical protein
MKSIVVCAGVFLVACSSASPESGESSSLSGVTAPSEETLAKIAADPDYVRTPNGYYHRSCVHDLGENAIVDRESASKCAFPFYPARTVDDSPVPFTQNPAWHAYAYNDNTATPFKTFTATWGVPPAPTSQNSQVVYFFPGFEPADHSVIIQPVLQWNHDKSQQWEIASWYCDNGGNCGHSTPKRVYSGNTIQGNITAPSGCSSGVCTVFSITTQNLSNGDSTTYTYYNLNRAMTHRVVTLESYGITSCSQYPSSGSLSMQTYVTRWDNTVANGLWLSQVNGGNPNCGYGVSSSGWNQVTLYF